MHRVHPVQGLINAAFVPPAGVTVRSHRAPALCQQIEDVDRQSRRQAIEQIHARVELAPLDAAHVGAVHAGIDRQTFLGDAALNPQPPQVPGNACSASPAAPTRRKG